jgi:CDP-paratose 2-epimerase
MSVIAAPNVRRAVPRVLVTGGCGFIGCNLAAALAARGQDVLVLDRLSRAGAQENADWLKERHRDRIAVEILDIRDEQGVRQTAAQASGVLHLAAQVAVTTSLDDPIEDFDVNARGTLNVLEAIRRTNPAAPLVFASTNKVYGRLLQDHEFTRRAERYAPLAARFPYGVAEDAALDLYSPYGCSKGAADQYVHDYGRVFGLRTVVMRMSCIYGPRQFGTEDQGWLAHFLLQGIRGRAITIYGDGYQVRDALYVEDAVAAWIGALDRIEETRGRIFNLGGGPANAVSLREMIGLIAELRGEAPQIAYDAWRPGDQPWYVSDIREISRTLDWAPRTSLRDGLRKLDAWLSSRFGDTRPAVRLPEARAS